MEQVVFSSWKVKKLCFLGWKNTLYPINPCSSLLNKSYDVCVSNQVSYYFLRIFMIYFHCTSYPLPHPLKYVLLWEMNWNKVSLMIFDKNTSLLFLKVFYKTTNPLFLRIFSENVPLNVSTVSPLPSPPTHTFHGAASELDFTLHSK